MATARVGCGCGCGGNYGGGGCVRDTATVVYEYGGYEYYWYELIGGALD